MSMFQISLFTENGLRRSFGSITENGQWISAIREKLSSLSTQRYRSWLVRFRYSKAMGSRGPFCLAEKMALDKSFKLIIVYHFLYLENNFTPLTYHFPLNIQLSCPLICVFLCRVPQCGYRKQAFPPYDLSLDIHRKWSFSRPVSIIENGPALSAITENGVFFPHYVICLHIRPRLDP